MYDKLQDLKKLRKEIAGLKYSIEHAKPEMMTDFYKDYKTGKGVPKSLTGLALDKEVISKRKKQLKHKLRGLRVLVEDLEKEIDSIHDPELRTIARLYYINGLTQDEISSTLNYGKTTICRRLAQVKKVGTKGTK